MKRIKLVQYSNPNLFRVVDVTEESCPVNRGLADSWESTANRFPDAFIALPAPRVTESILKASVHRVASAFIRGLAEYLTPEQMVMASALNWANGENGCCATHEFCDANVFMDEAIQTVLGIGASELSDALTPMDGSSDDWGMSDSVATLWGDAWRASKTPMMVQYLPCR